MPQNLVTAVFGDDENPNEAAAAFIRENLQQANQKIQGERQGHTTCQVEFRLSHFDVIAPQHASARDPRFPYDESLCQDIAVASTDISTYEQYFRTHEWLRNNGYDMLFVSNLDPIEGIDQMPKFDPNDPDNPANRPPPFQDKKGETDFKYGNSIFLYNADPFVIAHELGHIKGLLHYRKVNGISPPSGFLMNSEDPTQSGVAAGYDMSCRDCDYYRAMIQGHSLHMHFEETGECPRDAGPESEAGVGAERGRCRADDECPRGQQCCTADNACAEVCTGCNGACDTVASRTPTPLDLAEFLFLICVSLIRIANRSRKSPDIDEVSR